MNRTLITLGPGKFLKLLCIFYSSVTLQKFLQLPKVTKCTNKKIHALVDFFADYLEFHYTNLGNH